MRQCFKTPSPPLFFFSPEPSYRENQCHRSPVGGGEETFFFQGAFGWRRRRHTHVRTHSCSGDDDTIMVEEEQKGGGKFRLIGRVGKRLGALFSWFWVFLYIFCLTFVRDSVPRRTQFSLHSVKKKFFFFSQVHSPFFCS